MSELDGFTDDLKHKVGPLPAWAWGGIGAVSVVLLLRVRRSRTSKPAAPDPGAVADPGMEASGIVPAYDASLDSVLHNSAFGSAGGQSIPVPLDQTQFDVMLHDYLVSNGDTSGEASAATPVGVTIPGGVTVPGASTPAGSTYLPPNLTGEVYGPDPERPGSYAYLNPQGYRDLGNPLNYPVAPLPSQPVPATSTTPTYGMSPPPTLVPGFSSGAYAYIDQYGRKVDQAGVPV